jgi:predicted acylesterase/phospholipase RssA
MAIDTDRHIGIVLGGGGLLGDFQVGALKYLYDKGKVREEEVACIAGTSVGAINGVILASTSGCNDQLEKFWLKNVITPRDILEEEMWFEGIAPLLGKMLKGRPLERVGTLHGLLKALLKESRDHLFAEGLWGIVNIRDLLTNVLTRKSLYTTAVLRDRLELVDLGEALRSEIALRLYAAELETGDCTCFCTTPRSAAAPTGTCTKFLPCTTPKQLADAALASAALPGVFPPLKVRGKYYIDGSVREVVPFRGAIDFGEKIDMIYVILCMPRLAQVGKAAAENPEDACKKTDWDDSHLVDIALQSAYILVDEMVHNDLDYKLPCEIDKKKDKLKGQFKSPTIAPLVLVHGMIDLSIGKIKINMDQGYMCAYDEVWWYTNNYDKVYEDTYQEYKRLTRLITSTRLEIWQLEHELIEDLSTVKHRSIFEDYYPWHVFDPRRIFSEEGDKVHTEILYDIREKKRRLKEHIDERLKKTHTTDSLPDCYEEMYMHWELHNWDLEIPTKKPPIPTPWDRLDLGRHGKQVICEEEPPDTTLRLEERTASGNSESRKAPESASRKAPESA